MAKLTAARRKELREFGLVMGGMVCLFFGLLMPWLRGAEFPLWPRAASLAFLVLAAALPQSLYFPRLIWMRFGLMMGDVNSRIIIFITYYLLVTPIGIVRRIVLGDPLKLRFDSSVDSYRIVKSEKTERTAYQFPF